MQILSIAKGLFNKIIDGTLKAGDVKSANESIMEMVNINLLPGNILIIIQSVGIVSLNTRIWYAASKTHNHLLDVLFGTTTIFLTRDHRLLHRFCSSHSTVF
jgi:hypothetical protein